MSLRKIKFGDKEVLKVVSKKCKINDTTYKYICGYLNNDTIQLLCVILPQMNGYIKYFDDGGKNMSFVMDDEEIYEKYNKIWEMVRKILKLDFTVGLVRDDKYLVAKLKIFGRINRTTFANNAIPIERNHYICIPAIDIDSVLKIDKRAYPEDYLEQCKYKLKKRKHVNFFDDEIIDEDGDSDIDNKISINNELKL